METTTKDITLVTSDVNRQLADPKVASALLENTFKGMTIDTMKRAIMEGVIRGFTFKDFLEKNVYAIKYGDGYSLVTSIDHNRKIGMKSGVVGTDAPVYVMTQEKTREANIPKPESCSVTVKRLVNGHIGEFTALVYFDEYYKAGKEYNGKYTPSMWDQKPRTMIAKVAEMHALRKACPEELSNAYVEEEMQKGVVEMPAFEIEPHRQRVREATDIEDLKNIWASLPAQAKTDADTVKIKEEMKAKFGAQTPPPPQNNDQTPPPSTEKGADETPSPAGFVG